MTMRDNSSRGGVDLDASANFEACPFDTGIQPPNSGKQRDGAIPGSTHRYSTSLESTDSMIVVSPTVSDPR